MSVISPDENAGKASWIMNQNHEHQFVGHLLRVDNCRALTGTRTSTKNRILTVVSK
jgi:hypothetical protein